MIELRWYEDRWIDYSNRLPERRIEKPVLQARYMVNIEELGIQEPIWSEWQDVPTVYAAVEV